MNINELMSGDLAMQWYRSSDSLHDHCEVVRMDKHRLHVVGWKYEPIPLTLDILKANGFKCKDHCARLDLSLPESTAKDERYIYCQIHEDKSVFEVKNFSKIVTYMDKSIYVHNLQQALRLCKYIDLANNFKVE